MRPVCDCQHTGVTDPNQQSARAGLAVDDNRRAAFTVYCRIRSFRQHPVSGRWDATNKENIIEDSRYVMLVDRSEVNRPGDKPRIIYLEKVP